MYAYSYILVCQIVLSVVWVCLINYTMTVSSPQLQFLAVTVGVSWGSFIWITGILYVSFFSTPNFMLIKWSPFLWRINISYIFLLRRHWLPHISFRDCLTVVPLESLWYVLVLDLWNNTLILKHWFRCSFSRCMIYLVISINNFIHMNRQHIWIM